MDNTLSTTEAANAIGVHRATVHRYCVNGILPAQRRGLLGEYRINPEDLRKFAEKHNFPFDLPKDR
jgi:excisionase family DNA binding protein